MSSKKCFHCLLQNNYLKKGNNHFYHKVVKIKVQVILRTFDNHQFSQTKFMSRRKLHKT